MLADVAWQHCMADYCSSIIAITINYNYNVDDHQKVHICVMYASFESSRIMILICFS